MSINDKSVLIQVENEEDNELKMIWSIFLQEANFQPVFCKMQELKSPNDLGIL